MDLRLLKRFLLDSNRRKNRRVLLLAALGFSSYAAYKFYQYPAVAEKRKRISIIFGSLISTAEVISDSAEIIGLLSKDFKGFLLSESDQIPNSLKQISKVARSGEFSEAVAILTRALTVGLLRGYQSFARIDDDACGEGNDHDCPSFLDKVLDKLSSPAGSGLVSVVVGSFARNLVVGLYEGGQSIPGLNLNSSFNGYTTDDHGLGQKFVDLVCGYKGKELTGHCIQLFVGTAVAVYLDKTMHINTYDEIFAGLTNGKHEMKIREALVSVCNGAIETILKTSHHVLTTADSNMNLSFGSSYLDIHRGESAMQDDLPRMEAFSGESETRKPFEEVKENSWADKVSATLAVPSNKKFVLDVTGRVTFETMWSFLEFLLEKLYNEIKRCFMLSMKLLLKVVWIL